MNNYCEFCLKTVANESGEACCNSYKQAWIPRMVINRVFFRNGDQLYYKDYSNSEWKRFI